MSSVVAGEPVPRRSGRDYLPVSVARFEVGAEGSRRLCAMLRRIFVEHFAKADEVRVNAGKFA